MNDEIKEILDYLQENSKKDEATKQLVDYITNLQQENERLKRQLNCKEYFSSTMPENIEFVILTKNNYDRQQKDIELELIDYKSRIEKTVEKLKKIQQNAIKYGAEHDAVVCQELIDGLNGRSDE